MIVPLWFLVTQRRTVHVLCRQLQLHRKRLDGIALHAEKEGRSCGNGELSVLAPAHSKHRCCMCHSHPSLLGMASDIGSRNAPDIGKRSATADEHTEEQRQEMAWLAALVGCASPFPAPASGAAAAGSASTASALLRVHLHDGRIYSGRLQCVDSRCNLVLAQASQEASVIDGIPVGNFQLGQALVNLRLVQRVERIVSPPPTTAASGAEAKQ